MHADLHVPVSGCAGRSRRRTAGVWAAALCAGLLSLPAAALQLGQVDDFSGAVTDGWSSGGAHPTPPVGQAGGGPAGAADSFLLLQASGQGGAGGRLVAFSGGQWAGSYIAAGVTALRMDANNLGDTDLSLRLSLGTAGSVPVVSSSAVLLPAGSGWRSVVFSLAPADLTGNALPLLGNLNGFRLYHGTTATFPGEFMAARLGIDNVTAVPEPGAALLMAAGLAGLALLRRPSHLPRRTA